MPPAVPVQLNPNPPMYVHSHFSLCTTWGPALTVLYGKQGRAHHHKRQVSAEANPLKAKAAQAH